MDYHPYQQLHSDILSGKLPNRQLIAVEVQSGFVDNLTGLISAFYLAMFTNRANRFVSYGKLPKLEAAVESPFINWHSDESEFPNAVLDPMKFTFKDIKGYEGPDRDYDPKIVDIENIGHCIK
jgi:hypothetical protein